MEMNQKTPKTKSNKDKIIEEDNNAHKGKCTRKVNETSPTIFDKINDKKLIARQFKTHTLTALKTVNYNFLFRILH